MYVNVNSILGFTCGGCTVENIVLLTSACFTWSWHYNVRAHEISARNGWGRELEGLGKVSNGPWLIRDGPGQIRAGPIDNLAQASQLEATTLGIFTQILLDSVTFSNT